MRAHRVVVCVVLTAGASLATAQPTEYGGWRVEVIGDPVSPQNPTTTVRVSAYFPRQLWGYSQGFFDLVGDDVSGEFSDFFLPAPLGPHPPGIHGCVWLLVGSTMNGAVYDVLTGQLTVVGCIADPTNPLPVFEAQWTTSDFTPRTVELFTSNTQRFSVYVDHNGSAIDLVARNQFRHGSAVIQVIPTASAAALLLSPSGAVMLRRRRRMPHPEQA